MAGPVECGFVRASILSAVGAVGAAICAAVALAAPTPSTEQQRIVAEFGRTYLPRFMPPGYVYVRWSAIQGSTDASGEWPQILFGDHGRRVQWTVENARDADSGSHEDCVEHRPFATKVFHVEGRTIYYAGGAVGQDATICLPNSRGLVVWNDYSLSKQTLVKVAASAHAVG
jgi:hypothetical protein